MNAAELYALLPLVLVALGALAVLLAIAVRRSPGLSLTIALIALAAAFVAILAASAGATTGAGALVTVDGFGRFYIAVILLAAAALAVFGYGYLRGREEQPEEYFVLLLLATLGAGVLVVASHLVTFFVALEILSVSLFGLIAYPRDQRTAIEAGVKYLVLAAVSASFLLFGMALVYSQTGALAFTGLGRAAASPVLLAGAALLVVGVGFKLGVVPFHLWAPDIFQGAPPPTAALVATISKGAVVALLLRFLYLAGPAVSQPVIIVLAVVALLSMLGGNLLALYQRDVRRILAYSSISHLGFILIAALSSGALALSAATFYVSAYVVTNLVVFGALVLLAASGSEWTEVRVYRGLFWRRPWVATALALGLVSLAGIPLTGGFVAKFYVGAAGVAGSLWVWVLALVLGSTIGLFYYLRWAGTMFLERPEQPVSPARLPLFAGGVAVVAALAVALVALGVYPAPLISVIEAAVATLP